MTPHQSSVSTLKGLAIDAVQAANSGHPGMPMGCADIATVLWTQFLKHDPAHPNWPDRDRFVLSPGHGSALLYGLLHLAGYPLSLDDLRQFRQWGSQTPGHPEVGHTVGVEMTTGPLGQGFAMGVGLAIGERWKRTRFGADLCDHFIYGIVSDGDLMEGVVAEAASLAGHLKLGKIIYLYDDNEITIDGRTEICFTEDRAKRFEAYGWHVQQIDGHDPEVIADAIHSAQRHADHPSLICCRTTIGQSCAIEGTSKTHGAPLGEPEVRATKQRIGLDPKQHFQVLPGVLNTFRAHDGPQQRERWADRFAQQGADYSAFLSSDASELIASVEWPDLTQQSLASRKASQACLQAIVSAAPQVFGGSADLAGSNGTKLSQSHITPDNFSGQVIDFGIREHAMASICNGLSLHGGFRPYNATFLVFHDYMRPAVRLSALMKQPVIYIYTHDSILLGEDGPTHQPIETLLALRALPNVSVLRPCDAAETVEAWKFALARADGPTALILTRQTLRAQSRAADELQRFHEGAYCLVHCDEPDVTLIGTGSEVQIAVDAQIALAKEGVRCKVVSMPCVGRFLQQPIEAQRALLPTQSVKISIEAGVTLGWRRIVGDTGLSIGVDTFGASAPADILADKYGLTAEAVTQRVLAHLNAQSE